jgi:5-methylcytosine-specific restriction endonuclease McrA
MKRKGEFSLATQKLALARQKNLCASCGTPISELGQAGRAKHQYGEGVQAHHVKHIKFGGTNDVSNCVIICDACHYNVHEGGNYRFGTVIGEVSDFEFYSGTPPE